MAGARHTPRHLQRMMLRGLVLPAAAAGAIVLGASAASADEAPAVEAPAVKAPAVKAPGGGAVELATSDGVSAVEDAGTAVGGTTDPSRAAGVPSGAGLMPPSGASVDEPVTEPPTPSSAGQPSSGPGRGGGPLESVTPLTVPADRAAGGAEPLPVPDPVQQVAEAPRGDARTPAPPTGEVLPEPEAAPILDDVARTVTSTVGSAADPVVEAASDLAATARSTVDAPAPTDTVADRLLAPAVATTPIFTGAADSLLTEISSTTATVDPLASPVAALPTDPTPMHDELLQELAKPLATTTSVSGPGVQAPSLPTAGALLPLLTPGYAPDGGEYASADGRAGSSSTPWPTGTTEVTSPNLWASGPLDVPLDQPVTAPTADTGRAALVVVPLLHEPLDRAGGALGTSLSDLLAATAEPVGAGATDTLPTPDPRLLNQVGGLAEAVAAAAGGGTQGSSGSVLLLLLVVLGSALLLRANALPQLVPGAATALSGRAALVEDHPG